MKMHQNYGLLGLCLLLLLFSNINTYSQNYYPQLRYENGDTIPYTFPPPDSTYIQTFDFNVQDLTPGVYFFNILTNNDSKTLKIIVKGE